MDSVFPREARLRAHLVAMQNARVFSVPISGPTATSSNETLPLVQRSVIASPTFKLHRGHTVICVLVRSLVGSKSLNIAKLKSALPKDVLTPYSITLPFGSLQRTLHAPENAETLKSLSAALRKLSIRLKNSEAEAIFETCQKSIAKVAVPRDLRQALEEALHSIDAQGGDNNYPAAKLGTRPHLMDLWNDTGDAKCTQALIKVWASLFGLRPWVSLTKASRDYCELNMAVLIQVSSWHPNAASFCLRAPESLDKGALGIGC